MNEEIKQQKRTNSAVNYDRLLCAGLTAFQKEVLKQMILENLYILEILDFNKDCKMTFTLTNGEDDIKDLRPITAERLKKLEFILPEYLPDCVELMRTKYYIPENMRTAVFLACA